MSSGSSPNHNWLQANMFNEWAWYPKKLGKRRLIFQALYDRTRIALFIDPPTVLHPAEWPCAPGKHRMDALTEALGLLAAARTAFVFYATFDDGAFVTCHWEHPFSSSWWGPGIFSNFETIPSDQGGPRYLSLCFPEENSAVIFTLDQGFEIGFYGSRDLWQELHKILHQISKVTKI